MRWKLAVVLAAFVQVALAQNPNREEEDRMMVHIGGSVVFVQRVLDACRPLQVAGDLEAYRQQLTSALNEWTRANSAEVNALQRFHSAFARFLDEREKDAQVRRAALEIWLRRYRENGAARRDALFNQNGGPLKACATFFDELRAGKHNIAPGAPNPQVLQAFTARYNVGRESDRLYFDIFPLLLAQAPARAGSPQETLQVAESDAGYVLSVPISKLSLTLPKPLRQQRSTAGGSTDHPRYFYFIDPARGLAVSGWFEPANKFRGARESWDADAKESTRRGMEPKDVAFEKIGDWDVIFYDLQLPQLAGANNAHIRAHLVQAGTWIDMHLSITSNGTSAVNRAALAEWLKTVRVTEAK